MNREMVSALAGLFGVLGVIGSLAYVAVQIRQSTTVSRRRAVAELLDQTQGFLQERF